MNERTRARTLVAGSLRGRWPLAAIAAAAMFVALPWLMRLDARPLPGLRIHGAAVPRDGSLAAFLRARAAQWQEEAITLETGVHVWHPTPRELGASLDVDEALRAVHAHGRSANPLLALESWLAAQGGAEHAVSWRPRVDGAILDAYVARIRGEIERLPTAASVAEDGARIAGLPGEAVDVEATRRAIELALRAGRTRLHVRTVVTEPLATVRAYAAERDEATVLMMRQETQFRARSLGRATNIALAAQKIEGRVLMPGAAFSFNRVVGKRTAAAGFAPAQELVNGEVVLGIGGGVCQVAGTLHAAAFFAGLTVEEYRAHSRLTQFSSLRPGLDTMVAWPDDVEDVSRTKDMRLRNPYPFPVWIRAVVLPESGGWATLRVELYGAARPFRVDFGFEEVARIPAGEVRRPDASLARGVERVQQEAAAGSVIIRRRTIYTPSRRVEEATRIRYPPTPRVVLVGAR